MTFTLQMGGFTSQKGHYEDTYVSNSILIDILKIKEDYWCLDAPHYCQIGFVYSCESSK